MHTYKSHEACPCVVFIDVAPLVIAVATAKDTLKPFISTTPGKSLVFYEGLGLLCFQWDLIYITSQFWTRVIQYVNGEGLSGGEIREGKTEEGGCDCERIMPCLKGPKHDQVECGFFYTNQTHMVRWRRDWRKKLFLFMIGGDIRHFVFLAKAEHTLVV